MSVAKRDRGKDPKPLPPNEDEGKLEENDARFGRTNQALKWAKAGITDAKLYMYAKTGQIQESEDPSEVSEAFQKLDTYKEQIDSMLRNAENWTKSMLQTWNYQTHFIDSLKECNTVIQSFNKKTDQQQQQQQSPSPNHQNLENVNDDGNNDNNDKNNKNEEEDEKCKSDSPTINLTNNTQFAQVVKGISDELYLDQQESERRYGHASKLLVVPLRNILSHEIMHAVDMKRKYIQYKRQFDNCCTTITHLKDKIEEIDNPKKEEEKNKNENVGTFGKIKMGFGKLIQSNPTRDELESKLKDARSQLPQYIKVFEEAKKKLLESINIIEEKLNIEVVYYVQQFYSFVKQWKSGNAINIDQTLVDNDNNGNDKIEEEQQENNKNKNNDNKNEEIVVQEITLNDDDDNVKDKGKEDDANLISSLQMDSMMNNPEMDEVNLDSPNESKENVNNEHNVNNDKLKNIDISNPNDVDNDNDDGNDDNNDQQDDNVDIDEIEISENHDVET